MLLFIAVIHRRIAWPKDTIRPQWIASFGAALGLLLMPFVSASVAQSTGRIAAPEIRMDAQRGTANGSKIRRSSSVRPERTSRIQSIKSSASGQLKASEEQSILSSVNHDELIIPSALESTESCDSCANEFCDDPIGDQSWNVYDFVTTGPRCASRAFLLDWSRADLWVGSTAFTNPASSFFDGANRAGQVAGSFGFQQGFNFGSQLPGLLSGQVGSQIGMRFVQSSLHGSELTESSRNQILATAGLYRRVDYGLQGGFVFDYQHEHWIYKSDLWQFRGELSFVLSPAHEVGFRLTENGKLDHQRVTLATTSATLDVTLRAIDTFRLFLRRRFGAHLTSSAEMQLGTTDVGGVLLACAFEQPLTGQLGLSTSALALIPKSSATDRDTHEAWNLSVALVWTPGRRFGTQRDYNRPLFEVAGNGSWITGRQ